MRPAWHLWAWRPKLMTSLNIIFETRVDVACQTSAWRPTLMLPAQHQPRNQTWCHLLTPALKPKLMPPTYTSAHQTIYWVFPYLTTPRLQIIYSDNTKRNLWILKKVVFHSLPMFMHFCQHDSFLLSLLIQNSIVCWKCNIYS